MAAPWFQNEIIAETASALPGLEVEVVPEVDSTSSELMRRAREGRCEPVLLVAERQTAGRGRMGRVWQSAGQAGEAQSSLTFSLGLPLAPKDWSGLSLAVGVSVAESLDGTSPMRVALKWPNDLWVDDRKLGGILIETALPLGNLAGRYLVIGIGLNIGAREAEGLSTAPAWLQQWRPGVTPGEVLREVVPPLARAVQLFGERGFAPFAERFAARDALFDRQVQLSDGTIGRCDGVGWGGELRVLTASGLKLVASAEISVRPRTAT
jgi:BirA family biotin operon repressor/biotin-[acetyl-CoA-carboxylase] ligase